MRREPPFGAWFLFRPFRLYVSPLMCPQAAVEPGDYRGRGKHNREIAVPAHPGAEPTESAVSEAGRRMITLRFSPIVGIFRSQEANYAPWYVCC